MPTFVIAAYSCEVARQATNSVDFQVRYFETSDVDAITSRLLAEKPVSYANGDGEEVRWLYDGIVAVEVDPKFADGEEVIGFITSKPMPLNK